MTAFNPAPLLSRRTVLAGAAATVTALSVAGCNSKSSSSSDGPIRLLAGGGRWEKGGYGWNQIQEFNKAHPDETVEVISAGQDVVELFSQQASTGNFPDILMGGMDLPTMLEKDWALPITELGVDVQSRYPAEMWVDGVTTSDGKIYSWGQDDGRGLFLGYNLSFLADAGSDEPPATWAELIEQSAAINAKNKDVFGIAMPLLNGEAIDVIARSIVSQNPALDGGFNLTTGRYEMDVYYTKAMEILVELAETKTMHPNSSKLSYADVDGYWNSERSAFNVDGTWLCSVAKERDFSDYEVAPPPVLEEGDASIVYGTFSQSSFFVLKQSERQDAVKDVVDFLTGEEFVSGQLTVNYSIPPNPELNMKYAPSDQVKELLEIQSAVIQPPVPETDPAAMEARKKESALPAPRQAAADIADGVLAGKIDDWQGALKKMNDEFNQRFDKALEETKCSRDKFTFADWDGTSNYPLKSSI